MGYVYVSFFSGQDQDKLWIISQNFGTSLRIGDLGFFHNWDIVQSHPYFNSLFRFYNPVINGPLIFFSIYFSTMASNICMISLLVILLVFLRSCVSHEWCVRSLVLYTLGPMFGLLPVCNSVFDDLFWIARCWMCLIQFAVVVYIFLLVLGVQVNAMSFFIRLENCF